MFVAFTGANVFAAVKKFARHICIVECMPGNGV